MREGREHDIKAGQEFAILTNIIHTEWSGVSVKDHKAVKGLSSYNLHDHMGDEQFPFWLDLWSIPGRWR